MIDGKREMLLVKISIDFLNARVYPYDKPLRIYNKKSQNDKTNGNLVLFRWMNVSSLKSCDHGFTDQWCTSFRRLFPTLLLLSRRF